MCPVFLMCGGLGGRSGSMGAALPDAWEDANSRRRERHSPCRRTDGMFAGSLTAKGEPMSVGSEQGFPLERAYACPADRVRESRCETAFPMLRGWRRTRWIAYRKGLPVSVGSEPGFSPGACVCMPGRPGAGGYGMRWHSPCGGADGVLRVSGRSQTAPGFPAIPPPPRA